MKRIAPVAGSLALFAAITTDLLLHGPLTSADPSISLWLHARMQPALTQALLAITHMHSQVGLVAMSAALAVFLFVKGRASWILWLVLTVQGGQVLNALVKEAFHRARPHWDEPIVHVATYSFPSGHACGATVFWGFACVLAWAWPAPPAVRRTIAIVAPVMVALTAFSRVYLGAHYTSDVLAGICEGVAWVSVSAWVLRAQIEKHAVDQGR